jgi:hypothetical protein
MIYRETNGQFRRLRPWERGTRGCTIPAFQLVHAGSAAEFIRRMADLVSAHVGDEETFPRDGEVWQGSWPPGGLRLPSPAPVREDARYGFVLDGRYHSVRVVYVFKFDQRWKLRVEYTNAPKTALGNSPSQVLSWQQFRRLPGLISFDETPERGLLVKATSLQ